MLSDVCIGQHSVCLLRAAKVSHAGVPVGGAGSGIATAAVVSGAATLEITRPDFGDVTTVRGVQAYVPNPIPRYIAANIDVEIAVFDFSAMALLSGGTTLIGGSASDLTGDPIGWAAPAQTATPPLPIYLEFITRAVPDDAALATESIGYVGHIFGSAHLAVVSRNYALEAATLQLSGRSIPNPNLGAGPWNDWPGTGNVPASAYIQIGYTVDEFDAIADEAACGLLTLPDGGS